MKAETSSDVTEIKKQGISVRIRPTIKNGTTYFVLDYRANGKRKLVWRASLEDAKAEADRAIEKITEGQAEVLNLTSSDAHTYTRFRAALQGIEKEIDEVAREYAEAYHLLGAGRELWRLPGTG